LRETDVQQPNTASTFRLLDQLAGLFSKQRPVGSRVDDDSFELLAKKAALLVLLLDEHQHHVFERGFRNRHRAGQRVQDADLDLDRRWSLVQKFLRLKIRRVSGVQIN
jgi:hypothetical protein